MASHEDYAADIRDTREPDKSEESRLRAEVNRLTTLLSVQTCFSCHVAWSPENEKEACDLAHREHWGHEWVTPRVVELTKKLFEANEEVNRLQEMIKTLSGSASPVMPEGYKP